MDRHGYPNDFSVSLDTNIARRKFVFATLLCATGGVIIGIAATLMGGALAVFVKTFPFDVGFPLVLGVLIFVSGVFGLVIRRRSHSSALNFGHLALHCLTATLSLICILACAIAAANYAQYRDGGHCHDTLVAPVNSTTVRGNTNSTRENTNSTRGNTNSTRGNTNSTNTTRAGILQGQCVGPPDHWKFSFVLFICMVSILIVEMAINVSSVVIGCQKEGLCKACRCFVFNSYGKESSIMEYHKHNNTGQEERFVKQTTTIIASDNGDWSEPALLVPSES